MAKLYRARTSPIVSQGPRFNFAVQVSSLTNSSFKFGPSSSFNFAVASAVALGFLMVRFLVVYVVLCCMSLTRGLSLHLTLLTLTRQGEGFIFTPEIRSCMYKSFSIPIDMWLITID